VFGAECPKKVIVNFVGDVDQLCLCRLLGDGVHLSSEVDIFCRGFKPTEDIAENDRLTLLDTTTEV
jgi:hypothetical protein